MGRSESIRTWGVALACAAMFAPAITSASASDEALGEGPSGVGTDLSPPAGEREIPDVMLEAEPYVAQLIGQLVGVDGYAGVWTNYSAGPTVVVAGTDRLGLERAIAGVPQPESIATVVADVDASLPELLRAQELASDAVGELAGFSGIAVREHASRIEIEIAKGANADLFQRRADEIAGSIDPVRVEVVQLQSGPDEAAATLWGGGLFTSGSNCTSGFAMRRTTGGSWRGLVTAGHCNDNGLVQNSVSLGNAFYDSCVPTLYADKQYHTIPSPDSATNRISISTSPYYRDINDWETSPYYFWVGRSIEKQGRSTGYRTGSIETSWYTTNTCGPDAHQRVRATAYTLVGDSGGPVFSGNEALGVTSARTLAEDWVIFSRSSYIDYNGYVPCTQANCNG